MQSYYRFLADGILVLHAAIVFFVVGALPVIWFGYFRQWQFVRSFGFRLVHLVLIGIVAAESLLGLVCPLTAWEDAWRVRSGGQPLNPDGFIASWLHRLIFYDFDKRVFIAVYVLFFALVFVTWFAVRPRAPRFRRNLAR